MIDVLVVGAAGRMGSLVTTTVDRQDDMRTVALVDPAFGSAAAPPHFAGLDAALAAAKPQVAVEFSLPASVFDNTLRLLAAGVPTVVGATGLDDEMTNRLAQSAAKHAVGLVVAPNFALGAVLLMRFARQAARLFGRAEVVELHHEGKIDAPSARPCTPPSSWPTSLALPSCPVATTDHLVDRTCRASVSTVCAFPAWSRIRRCSSVGRRAAHAAPRLYVPGMLHGRRAAGGA